MEATKKSIYILCMCAHVYMRTNTEKHHFHGIGREAQDGGPKEEVYIYIYIYICMHILYMHI